MKYAKTLLIIFSVLVVIGGVIAFKIYKQSEALFCTSITAPKDALCIGTYTTNTMGVVLRCTSKPNTTACTLLRRVAASN
ncbi:hypothetical protein SAMN05428988_1468 [Chitinophaga sp. YR573]|uniref:hypothetical protein n=1 Tax=Chitinophaga sp. YR573 TaxID=1881040 RepID=UPI0008C9FC3A|nr:hypothetical protein [Chitinophaga sp. YR573]SEW03676.1 hypothetical protein SAMN05428988_1468 [Chitinophaga sp. YR573]